eukprot:7329535-Pyramimonas_sp.AAC.1
MLNSECASIFLHPSLTAYWEATYIPAGCGIHSAARTGDFRGNNVAQNRLFLGPARANMPEVVA